MRDFMIILLTYSAAMSVIILLYLAITSLLSQRYSARTFYYTGLIIQIGLLIPFRPYIDIGIIKPKISTNMIMPSPIHNIRHIQTLENIQTWSNSYTANLNDNTLSYNASLFYTQTDIQWWKFIVVIWLAGTIIFLIYHGIKHYRFIKITYRWSENISDERILELIEKVKRDLKITKQIGLYICPCIGSPVMIGFQKTRVLLPRIDISEDELSFILKHELIHYKRKDLWYKCLVLVATSVHWFNPIVYLMAKAINVQCELSCDAEVIRDTNVDMRQIYCEMLINMMKNQSKLKTALSTDFQGGKKGMKNIKKRIISIMDTKKKKGGLVIICLILIMTLGVGIANVVADSNNAADALANNMESDIIIRLRDYENLPEDYGTVVSNVDSRPGLEFYIEGNDIAQIELKCDNEYLYVVDWTETQHEKYWNVDYYQTYDEKSQTCTFYPERLYDKSIILSFDEEFSDYGDIWYRWTAWNLYQWASENNFSHFLGYGIEPKIKLADEDKMTEEEKLKLAAGDDGSGITGLGHIQLEGYPEELTEDRITITVTDRRGNSVTKYINIKISNNELNETVVTASVEN